MLVHMKLDLLKSPYSAYIDKTLQTILYTEKIKKISEIFDYVQASNVISKLDIELRNTIEKYQKKKELFIITMEFVSVTAADTMMGLQ